MTSDQAHFAWVIARDLFSYWSRAEPISCVCQCPENVCSCPPTECAAHLEVIRDLSLERAGAAADCPDREESDCAACQPYPWFLIFVLVISIVGSGVIGYRLGRCCSRRAVNSDEQQPAPAPVRVGPFTPATLAALER